jgi:hypothetical protein
VRSAAPADVRGIRRELDALEEWIDAAREALEALHWTAEDALRRPSLMTKKRLRRSANDDLVKGIRALRAAKQGLDATRGKLPLTGGVP